MWTSKSGWRGLATLICNEMEGRGSGKEEGKTYSRCVEPAKDAGWLNTRENEKQFIHHTSIGLKERMIAGVEMRLFWRMSGNKQVTKMLTYERGASEQAKPVSVVKVCLIERITACL